MADQLVHQLEMRHITREYEEGEKINKVLVSITYTFLASSSYAIMGVSGTGKSTLMHVLGGIDEPTKGSVFFDDISIYHLSSTERAHFLNKHIGLVFQEPYLLKEFTVIENIMLPGLIGGMDYKRAQKRAGELLGRFGLEQKADQHPLSLSGGQQQRIAILRAFFNNPTFLLADEPTGNLDIDSAKEVVDLLSEASNTGMGLIVCTHDSGISDRLKRRVVLKHGKLVNSGKKEE